jgi:hypothetical protein
MASSKPEFIFNIEVELLCVRERGGVAQTKLTVGYKAN